MKYATPFLFSIMLAHAYADTPPPSASEIRKVGAFHAIDLAGTMRVEVRIDRATRVEVVGDADRFKQVLTDVKDGTLVVDTRGKLDNSQLRVLVTVPDLDAVSVSGTGKLEVQGLANARLDARIPGTGAVKLVGSTGQLHVSVGGSGQLAAGDLAAKAVSVDVPGTAQLTVRASQSFDATIAGTGAIVVEGKPASVKKSVTGTAVIDVR
jgi:putative autotransporter adhesin-like protein